MAWPPALTVDVSQVLHLFTGENFYSSSDAALREAVLNAIDAIGRRRQSESNITPEIRVIFDTEQRTLTITDNGDGMSRDDLMNLFSKIGASASRIAQTAKKNQAIGEFGIGALSYFLVADRYHVYTHKQGELASSLEFTSAMLDAQTQATELSDLREPVGTTIVLFLNTNEHLDHLTKRFSYWMRNVDGLTGAVVGPTSREISQGGLTRQVHGVTSTEAPDWIETFEIGPPEELSIWDQYDGTGRVDVLYRGVFVERVEVEQLWAIEGAVHVNPKHFRPKLNREGFVGGALKSELRPFLEVLHPLVLEKAVECIHDLLQSRDHWNLGKAIALWLAVPRSKKYATAAKAWDNEFRNRKTFRLLTLVGEREISIAELNAIGSPEIFLVPDQLNQTDAVTTQAIRILLAQNQTVVQGLQRQSGYLATVSLHSDSTSWLLLNAFRSELPKITEVAGAAAAIVAQQAIDTVLVGPPAVKLVELGEKSAPFVPVNDEVWINVNAPASRPILDELFKRNEGHLSLWVACMLHASDQGQTLDQIGALIRRRQPKTERLGVARRQYLRSLIP